MAADRGRADSRDAYGVRRKQRMAMERAAMATVDCLIKAGAALDLKDTGSIITELF